MGLPEALMRSDFNIFKGENMNLKKLVTIGLIVSSTSALAQPLGLECSDNGRNSFDLTVSNLSSVSIGTLNMSGSSPLSMGCKKAPAGNSRRPKIVYNCTGLLRPSIYTIVIEKSGLTGQSTAYLKVAQMYPLKPKTVAAMACFLVNR